MTGRPLPPRWFAFVPLSTSSGLLLTLASGGPAGAVRWFNVALVVTSLGLALVILLLTNARPGCAHGLGS